LEIQVICFQEITLNWSDWHNWDDLKRDARSDGIKIPNHKPGVYEVRFKGYEKRLTIGKASNLRFRIRQGLVKGIAKHSSGKRIRASINTSNLEVRWAETDRPAAVEEELHKRHCTLFGCLPEYTKHT
jgi:excinuclease UvrABC nuclease subunit